MKCRIGRHLQANLGWALVLCSLLPRLAASSAHPNGPADDPGSPSATWVELAPPARTQHTAIFQASTGRMIIFGGRYLATPVNDVWALTTGGGKRWERLDPSGTPPSPRVDAAAVYDALRGRMLVIGGRDSSGFCNDVWELSFRGRPHWRKADVVGELPIARSRHSATLDPKNDRVLVFGGQVGEWEASNDLWQLSLTKPMRWTRLNTPGLVPSPRASHTASYAEDLGGIVLVGGAHPQPSPFDPSSCSQPLCVETHDTWFLSTGKTPEWRDLTAQLTGDPPCGIEGHAAAYDASTHQLFVAGGSFGYECFGQPKAWSLSLADMRWSAVASARTALGLNASAVLDPFRHRVLLYGGAGYGDSDPLSDAWAWDPGSQVLEREEPTVARPSHVVSQPAVYDPIRERMLIFDGQSVLSRSCLGDEEWTELPTAGATPPSRTGHLFVYDPKADRLIVSGGVQVDATGYPQRLLTDTWQLSLKGVPTWSAISGGQPPPPRDLGNAVLDPRRNRIIAFGGKTPWFNGTPDGVWALSLDDEPEWRPLATINVGPMLTGGSALYDPNRDRIVVYSGGQPGGDWWTTTDEVWELTLSGAPTWNSLAHEQRGIAWPASRLFHAAMLDSIADRMVIIGGYVPSSFGSSVPGDAWAMDLATNAWSKLAITGPPAPSFRTPLAVYDSPRDRMVIVENESSWALEFGRGRGAVPAITSSSPAEALTSAFDDSEAFRIGNITPNPAIRGATVKFTLPGGCEGAVEMADLAGRRVWSRSLRGLGAGKHQFTIDDDRVLSPGVYFVRLTCGGVSRAIRFVKL
jgi:Galactose oxidase, central domain/Kelch motif